LYLDAHRCALAKTTLYPNRLFFQQRVRLIQTIRRLRPSCTAALVQVQFTRAGFAFIHSLIFCQSIVSFTLNTLCAVCIFVFSPAFLPNALEKWDAARVQEWIESTPAFAASDAHKAAALKLCQNGPTVLKLPALLKDQVQRQELHAQLACPADLTSDAFLALQLGEVQTLIRHQTFHQSRDALLSLIELMENKKLGNYIEIKSFSHPRDRDRYDLIFFFEF
jgi:hypothetical protein